jgi:hypothetical protein
VRSPRPRSPKTVREFINERIGVQAREEAHKTEILNNAEESQKQKDGAVKEAVVISISTLHS